MANTTYAGLFSFITNLAVAVMMTYAVVMPDWCRVSNVHWQPNVSDPPLLDNLTAFLKSSGAIGHAMLSHNTSNLTLIIGLWELCVEVDGQRLQCFKDIAEDGCCDADEASNRRGGAGGGGRRGGDSWLDSDDDDDDEIPLNGGKIRNPSSFGRLRDGSWSLTSILYIYAGVGWYTDSCLFEMAIVNSVSSIIWILFTSFLGVFLAFQLPLGPMPLACTLIGFIQITMTWVAWIIYSSALFKDLEPRPTVELGLSWTLCIISGWVAFLNLFLPYSMWWRTDRLKTLYFVSSSPNQTVPAPRSLAPTDISDAVVGIVVQNDGDDVESKSPSLDHVTTPQADLELIVDKSVGTTTGNHSRPSVQLGPLFSWSK